MTKDSLSAELMNMIQEITEDFKLTKLKIFSKSGEIIYSTTSKDVGVINKNRYFCEIVAKGRVYTKVVNKDTKSLEGQLVAADVVETYIPTIKNNTFIGAFEIYYDITARIESLSKLLLTSSVALFVLVISLMGAIIVVLSKAGKNIFARERTEQTLRDREERFRIVFENAATGIALMANAGYFMKANQALCRILGYSEEELLGKTWVEITEPDDLDGCYDWLKRVKAGEQSAHEKRFIHKLGHSVWVMVSTSLVCNSQGRTRYYISLFQDIMSRKQAEEALRESEKKYRLLVKNLTSVVYKGYKDWSVEFFDEKIELITGYSADEFNSKRLKWIDIIVEKDIETAKEIFIQAIKTDKSYVREYRIKSKTGGIHWIEERGQIACDSNGKIECVSGTFFDKTEIKRLEAQLLQAQKMEAVGTLAGGIAHDFNNILQTISGFSEILLSDKDRNDPDYEGLEVIKQSVRKAADLIGQLMIFSRKVESELKPVILNPQIINVSKLLERTIPKMISIEHNLAQDLKIINADPLQIEQVLMNLGLNAKDAMPDGGRLIFETENITLDEQYCKAHPGAGPGEYVLLSVSDTGHGMDQETLRHTFEPFYTTKETGKGTGLGLAMVYGIVKSHGGYIMCYSEPGLGTTFKIYFQVLIIESPEQKAEPGAKPGAEALSGGRETVLLVDDDAAVLKSGKAMLERHGYTTMMAENGERAIEIYEKEKELIDLVILDVGMPGIGGHKCLKHLLKIDPGIKVVIATGYAPSGKVKETLESGATGFIAKPFLLADILKRVREALDKKQSL